jgi:tetratricopeptide (TPR) repeat protein
MARRKSGSGTAKSGFGVGAGDAVDAAQDIMYDAWETGDRRKRIALAKKALKVSSLCADAYVLLAQETAQTLDQAISLYRQGVAAGQKALGEATFRDDAGLFWGLLETRPYMRARHGLALSLWAAGLRDEAVTHYEDMLRLNPNDNQGIRYLLLDCLLMLGRDLQAEHLLKQYDDDGGVGWDWATALLSFRRTGDCGPSRKALAQAAARNGYVLAYLVGDKAVPGDLPDYISWGGEDEAVSYATRAAEVWASTPGALAWLRSAKAAGPLTRKSRVDRSGSADAETEIDPDRIDDAILALLWLGLHDSRRVWKTFDWDAMDRLHNKGFISNPVGKGKSVELTGDGAERSVRLLRDLFGRKSAGADLDRL